MAVGIDNDGNNLVVGGEDGSCLLYSINTAQVRYCSLSARLRGLKGLFFSFLQLHWIGQVVGLRRYLNLIALLSEGVQDCNTTVI